MAKEGEFNSPGSGDAASQLFMGTISTSKRANGCKEVGMC